MAIWQWSKTAANNSTADPTINFTEGQPPSTLNDADRALMARVAEYRDDTGGTLADTGSASAYVVTTNEGVQTPTPTDGTVVSFIPANANASGVTLKVDGGTAFPIQSSIGNAVATGFIVASRSYDVVFKASASAWLIKNSFSTALGPGTVTYPTIQNVAASSLLGNPTGSPATVSEITLGTNLSFSGSTLNGTAFVAPNIQFFTSGSSQTYTTPLNGSTLPLYLRIRMIGGGGGGAAASTNAGGAGSATSFAAWTANAGSGGVSQSGTGVGGAGGTGGTNGTGTLIARVDGGSGGGAIGSGVGSNGAGGMGAPTPWGGGGGSNKGAAGNNASANSGAGGGGGGSSIVISFGAGGGAGEFVEFIVTSPAASYTYTVGGGGSGGAAGGAAGGNGAAGRIEVIAYWQ